MSAATGSGGFDAFAIATGSCFFSGLLAIGAGFFGAVSVGLVSAGAGLEVLSEETPAFSSGLVGAATGGADVGAESVAAGGSNLAGFACVLSASASFVLALGTVQTLTMEADHL